MPARPSSTIRQTHPKSSRPRLTVVARHVAANRRFLLRVAERLMLHLPPRRPVVMLTGRELSRNHGECALIDGKFEIRLCKRLDEDHAIDVLFHEWAHALSWDACSLGRAEPRCISDSERECRDHGRSWGIAYAKVYVCFISEIRPALRVEDLNAAVFSRCTGRRWLAAAAP